MDCLTMHFVLVMLLKYFIILLGSLLDLQEQKDYLE
jgi:hypothetical protein